MKKNPQSYFIVWYLIFLVYIFYAVCITTDRVIVLEEGIPIPFLSEKFPFVPFYLLFPLLFLLTHSKFLSEGKIQDKFKINTGSALHLCPAFLFLFLQIRISGYQSLALISYHFLLFLLDLTLLFRFFRNKITFPILLILFIPAVSNFYLTAAVTLDNPSADIRNSAINRLFLPFNTVLSRENEPASFLFPYVDVSNQNLMTGRVKTYRSRSFKYAVFSGAVLDLSLFNRASVQYADFTDVQWKTDAVPTDHKKD